MTELTGISQGHGTLNAIYAATEKACEARNWDGVDLLIIGGDFQVRVRPPWHPFHQFLTDTGSP